MIARIAAAVLLAGPLALALASGGYFDQARLWAGIGAWALVAVAAFAAPRPLPRSRPALAALAGLAGLLAWTLASFAWGPLRAPAVDDAQRLALYLGALLAATALLRGDAGRWVVPALAAGIVVAALYGLSERLLPGLVELERSQAAQGRLDQPLTYWNAMGAWAAIGLVLCARLAATRPPAAAGAVPLGAAVALSFSRGAIAAALIGLAVLAALDPRRPALRAGAIAAGAALAAGVAAAALPAVRTFEGDREGQGLILLAVLVVLAAGAVLLARRVGVDEAPRVARRGLVIAVAVGAVVLAAGAAALEGEPDEGASATRLSSVSSNRYAYWEVAAGAFADAPLRGHGAGSFGADWLREREVDEVVRDAHSLELETAAELGLVGLALLALLVGGVAVAAARGGAAAVGPAAGLAVFAAHSALDWDWEMPALALVAVILAGSVLALSDDDGPPPRLGARAALAALAAIVVAGLAVELRAAGLVADARAAPGDPASLDRLDRAASSSLDATTPELDRGRLLLFAGRKPEAARVAAELVRREPDNALAWDLLRLSDPSREAEARRQLERLVSRPR